jgi:hypothetical protein
MSMTVMEGQHRELGTRMSQPPGVLDIIDRTRRAPSPQNRQPWRIGLRDEGFALSLDPSRPFRPIRWLVWPICRSERSRAQRDCGTNSARVDLFPEGVDSVESWDPIRWRWSPSTRTLVWETH